MCVWSWVAKIKTFSIFQISKFFCFQPKTLSQIGVNPQIEELLITNSVSRSPSNLSSIPNTNTNSAANQNQNNSDLNPSKSNQIILTPISTYGGSSHQIPEIQVEVSENLTRREKDLVGASFDQSKSVVWG